MANKSRRQFIGSALAGLTLASAANAQGIARRDAKPHIVIIGGGAGGATVARYLAMNSKGGVDVTLIEEKKIYQSCFFSNHYLGGFRAFETLNHEYKTLEAEYGIKVIHDRAIAVDRNAQKVKLTSGFVPYDALIIAPGIDFVESSVKGWSLASQDKMPHAYKGGDAVKVLRKQIEAMPKGGVFAMVTPDGTYRCPPGPYERATIVAHVLKQINPTAKIIIVDPKPLFPKMSLFRGAWRKYYKGMIDIYSDVDMNTFEVDPHAMTIKLENETVKVDACNVIPDQKAGAIAHLAGVTVDRWAPVHAFDMRSKLDDNIYVLGDAASQGDMPKSSFAANSQAKVCADAILTRLLKHKAKTPAFKNTCWSMLAPEDSVKIGASYEATNEGIKRVEGFISKRNEDAALRKQTHAESLQWYDGIISDMFG